MELIDKEKVVAEIERLRKHETQWQENHRFSNYRHGLCDGYKNILSFLNTLEVKEVYSEREQRMKECPYRQVGCTMYEDKILECTGACGWVVDYLNLKKLKAQKGE